MINKKSNTVEQGKSRSQSDTENQKQFLKRKAFVNTRNKNKRYMHIEIVKKQQQHLHHTLQSRSQYLSRNQYDLELIKCRNSKNSSLTKPLVHQQ